MVVTFAEVAAAIAVTMLANVGFLRRSAQTDRLIRQPRQVGLWLPVLLSICWPATTEAADWYLTAQSDCTINEPIIAAFTALAPTTIPIHAGSTRSAYAEAPISLINDITTSNSEKIIDRVPLTKAKSIDYRNAVKAVGSSYSIPYFVDVTTAIYAGMALGPALGTSVGLVFTYLIDQLKKPAASMQEFSLFIAEGGELNRRWKLLVDKDNGLYLVNSLEYAVSLGQEQRRFVTAGCSYPVRAIVSEFRTNERVGNKIVKPRGLIWGVFDIEDNRWDSTQLKYLRQDQEYNYYSEDAIENGRVIGQHTHRLSFRGGRWQYQNFNDGPNAPFKNLSGPLNAL